MRERSSIQSTNETNFNTPGGLDLSSPAKVKSTRGFTRNIRILTEPTKKEIGGSKSPMLVRGNSKIFQGLIVHEIPKENDEDSELILLLVDHLVSILLDIINAIQYEIKSSKDPNNKSRFKVSPDLRTKN